MHPLSAEDDALLTPRYPIESVDNALRLLLMLGDGQPIRVNAASRQLEVASSTAHRLISMLQAHKLVVQDPDTKAYVAGPALVALGLAVVHHLDIRAVARPVLEKLRDDTGETIALAVLQGPQVSFIDSAESHHVLRVASRVGMVLPAHCTSIGKVLLAELTQQELRMLYPQTKLAAMTDRSVPTRSKLEDQLSEVRVTGYGTNRGESEDGIGSVAAAVRDRYGRAIAGISIAGPLARLEPNMPELSEQVVAAAKTVTDALA